jgi:hypothetical protein
MNHTVIERDVSFLMAYREWFDSSACKDKCSWLMNQFELYKSLPKEVDKSLRFLINQSSVGIHWKFTDADTLLEAQFFMEFFRDQIQSIGVSKAVGRQTNL